MTIRSPSLRFILVSSKFFGHIFGKTENFSSDVIPWQSGLHRHVGFFFFFYHFLPIFDPVPISPHSLCIPCSAYMRITCPVLDSAAVIDRDEKGCAPPTQTERLIFSSRTLGHGWLWHHQDSNSRVSQRLDERSSRLCWSSWISATVLPEKHQNKTRSRIQNDFIIVYSLPFLGSSAISVRLKLIWNAWRMQIVRCLHIGRNAENASSEIAYSMWTLLTDLKRLI